MDPVEEVEEHIDTEASVFGVMAVDAISTTSGSFYNWNSEKKSKPIERETNAKTQPQVQTIDVIVIRTLF